MFDRDLWFEIWVSIRQNKLRTFLTGFSVAWGIFMVTMLLGAGTGLQNAGIYNLMGDADNLLELYPSRTSMPYRGLKKGRRITLNDHSLQKIDDKVDHAININPVLDLNGTVKYKKNIFGHFTIEGVSPQWKILKKLNVDQGRFLNKKDISDTRKVAVIGTKVAEQLFDHVDPIGHYIQIKEMPFLVVGIFDSEFMEDRDREQIFIPYSLVQRVFKKSNDISYASMQVDKAHGGNSTLVEGNIRGLLSSLHQFNPKDKNAIWIRNKEESAKEMGEIFAFLELFIWFISGGSIFAGAIGVSNIMIIVVRERTKEFGIRKAIGASPASVVGLILMEAISITLLFGVIGLGLGAIGIDMLSSQIENSEAFRNPSVNWNIAITTLVVLVIVGGLSGFIPAKRAAKIKPIEALRAE